MLDRGPQQEFVVGWVSAAVSEIVAKGTGTIFSESERGPQQDVDVDWLLAAVL